MQSLGSGTAGDNGTGIYIRCRDHLLDSGTNGVLLPLAQLGPSLKWRVGVFSHASFEPSIVSASAERGDRLPAG